MGKAEFIYYILFGVIYTVSLMPFFVLYAISDVLCLIMFYLIKYRKKTVLNNLRNAFPNKSEKEIKRIAKVFYQHLCDFFLESFKIASITQKQLDKRFTWENLYIFDDLYVKGKDVAIVSGHYGNWEYFINAPQHIKQEILVIYRPLKNGFAEWFVYRNRSKFGLTMIPFKQIYKEFLKAKESGEPKGIWFLGDQRPPLATSNFWTIFLNQETAVYTGLEKLSLKYNMAVVFMDIHKVKRGHYNAKFTLLSEDGMQSKEHELTEKHVRFLDNIVQERPEYWLWSHKRWKHTRPQTN